MHRAAARTALAATLLLAASSSSCSSESRPDVPDTAPVDASDGATDIASMDVARDEGPPLDILPLEDVVEPDYGPPPTGCHLADASGGPPDAAPDGARLEPNGYPPLRGPGGPAVAFTAEQLNRGCAFLDGGPTDRDHHNASFMLDGYLVMPWAHEAGGGGVSVWEFNDPCRPVHVNTVINAAMRETHATGVSFMGGRWLVTASLTGVMFWDASDWRSVRSARDFVLPDVTYPDSYRRVVFSTFWQAPYVYVAAADNGVFVVDATNPLEPRIVNRYVPVPAMRAGGIHAIGNLLVLIATEGSRTSLLDISDPANPRPIPGGSFVITDGTETRTGLPNVMPAYYGHVNGGRTYHTRHLLGGGLIIYDISNPSAPRFVSSYRHPTRANGGYVFLKEDVAFVGLSSLGAALDVSDPARPSLLGTFAMEGDLDTITPVGNVVILNADADARDGQASVVVPFRAAPDRRAPRVNMVVPRDGATNQALTTRVGVTFDEFVDVGTVWRGSFQVREAGSDVPLEGHYSGQEGVVNFWPARPLRPGVTYELVVPAGGVRDYAGNPTAVEFRSRFTTVACGGGP